MPCVMMSCREWFVSVCVVAPRSGCSVCGRTDEFVSGWLMCLCIMASESKWCISVDVNLIDERFVLVCAVLCSGYSDFVCAEKCFSLCSV